MSQIDYNHRGEAAPEGYRWVYGALERKPEPVTEPAPWELKSHARTARELKAFNPGAWFIPVSPDGLPINYDHTGYMTAAGAINALLAWCRKFKAQGGYRNGRGYFIPYSELFYSCNIETLGGREEQAGDVYILDTGDGED